MPSRRWISFPAPVPMTDHGAAPEGHSPAGPGSAAPSTSPGHSTPPGLTRRDFLHAAGLAGAGLAVGSPAAARASGGPRSRKERPEGEARRLAQESPFAVTFEDGAVTSLRRVDDTFPTEYVESGARLGDVTVRFRRDTEPWRTLDTTPPGSRRPPAGDVPARREVASTPGGRGTTTIVRPADADAPEVEVGFAPDDRALRWTVTLRNPSSAPVEVGDLEVPLPISRSRQREGDEWVSPPVVRHGLVSGHGSFFYWMRSNDVGPYLVLTVDPGTHLEYWRSDRGHRVYVHSRATAEEVARERGCTDWRLPNTSLVLGPGEARTYGFAFRWAEGYDRVRDILVEQGLVDVHVIPGMTLPADLAARFALRTAEPVASVEAEHPDTTELRRVSRDGEVHLYEVRFARLGENLLTVRFGDDRWMVLEFFVIEPVETVLGKRAAFVAAHQWRDSTKWYDGLIAEWAMDTHVMLSPDNYDRIEGWRRYLVTNDDAGEGKPAFVATKNAVYPVQAEVEALDYYVENFLWGGLQRSTDETFAYGIYHIPDWKQNRESHDPGRAGRQHLWRIYDYPHIVLLYYGLYRVARDHPWIDTYMEAKDYLRRAYGTAVALYTIPLEIERYSAYETGLMNEPVVEDVIDALYAEGMRDEAERLRLHWERKVRTFVVDDPDLFKSEYAFDTTGFETTHALARYALRVAEPGTVPDEEIRIGWVDYPPPTKIPEDAARSFMETQMAANVLSRGWLETAYYALGVPVEGPDYMSQMGGWSVLDYGLHYAEDPFPYLRLGYASILSAWALVNTGTAESGYGYWYPSPENDGAAGPGFAPGPFGSSFTGPSHCRGMGVYSGEMDLSFCAGVKAARTILMDDPLFGRVALGGEWRPDGRDVAVVPRDGVRRRFHAVLGVGRLHVTIERDRFRAERPVVVAEDLTRLRFELESDDPRAHDAGLRLEGLPAGTWEVREEGAPPRRLEVDAGWPVRVEVAVAGRRGSGPVTLARVGA